MLKSSWNAWARSCNNWIQDLLESNNKLEQQISQKHFEMLEPILNKLQKAIDARAAANGFTFILNQTTSKGYSTILYGPREGDITEDLLKNLNVPIPKESETSAILAKKNIKMGFINVESILATFACNARDQSKSEYLRGYPQ